MKCLLPPPFLNPKASLFWLKCPLNALSSVTVYVTLCSSITLYFQNHKGTQHKISASGTAWILGLFEYLC